MGRGDKTAAEHRGSNENEQFGARGNRDDPWNSGNFEDNPFRDLGAHDADHTDPINDELVWPSFENEDKD